MKIRRAALSSANPRGGVVLAVVLAGMVLLLLMLAALARRVIMEHRAIDSRAQSLQADWLLWSAKNRAQAQWSNGNRAPSEWNWTPNEPGLGKSVTARVLEQETPPAANQQIELRWTTDSGVAIERSAQIDPQPKSSNEASK